MHKIKYLTIFAKLWLTLNLGLFAYEYKVEVQETSEEKVKGKETKEAIDLDRTWSMAKHKADKIYGGFNIEVKVKGGFESRENEIGENTGPFAAFVAEVPLYSKDQRSKRENSKAKYLNDVYNKIEIIRVNRRQLKILADKADMLKSLMKSEGVEAVNEYYSVLEEVISKQEETDKLTQLLIEAVN